MDSAVSAHRKIELQAPEDLTYLVENVRRAATARLNEAFPPVDGAQDEDELRTRIEQLVNEVRSARISSCSSTCLPAQANN
jgi:kinetochor protein Mis14/NSL1